MSYKDNFRKYYNVGEQDIILCAVCGAVAVDIHHIKMKSQGGTDDVSNLVPLCRYCHQNAHSRKISEEYLKSRRELYEEHANIER